MQISSAVHRNQCHDQDRRSDYQDLAQVVLQPEGAGEDEVEGELFRLHGLIRAQLEPDGVALRFQQSVLHVPGKTVLAALVGLAAMGEAAVLELRRSTISSRWGLYARLQNRSVKGIS